MPKTIIIAKRKAQKAWTLACKHEGVKPSSLFVEFDEKNPFVDEYNKNMNIVLEYMQGE